MSNFLIQGLYVAAVIGLAVFGLHRYFLLWLHWRHRGNAAEPQGHFEEVPVVTVQLPVFNERHVVERLLRAAAALDYPRDRLEIQLLDDSTDDTPVVVAPIIEELRADGADIKHIRRADRVGYKAGALAVGVSCARGEFIAVFDADFVPEPDFLRRSVHYFTDPTVGMVQCRWGHINRGYSLLSRVQAILLDGHFLVEQEARFRAGRFFNFNGTAGVWRTEAIEDAGGWQHDTLTEDLDLSYRAQLRGWHFVFDSRLVVPAELPVEMNAYKTQQHRWAKGSIQTARKLLPQIWRSRIHFRQKVEATFHLTSNICYLFMLMPSLLALPLLPLRHSVFGIEAVLLYGASFVLATLSVVAFYRVVGRESGEPVGWAWSAVLMSVGIGLSFNNARAVIEALVGNVSGFERTPKYRIESTLDRWRHKAYAGSRGRYRYVEVALGAYFSVAIGFALECAYWGAIPFLLFFGLGFAYVGICSVQESRGAARHSSMAAMATGP